MICDLSPVQYAFGFFVPLSKCPLVALDSKEIHFYLNLKICPGFPETWFPVELITPSSVTLALALDKVTGALSVILGCLLIKEHYQPSVTKHSIPLCSAIA